MNRMRASLLMGLLGLVAGACGSPGGSQGSVVTTAPPATVTSGEDLQTVGECSNGHRDFTVLPELLESPDAWLETSTARVLTGAEIEDDFVLLSARGADLTLLGGSLVNPETRITILRNKYNRLSAIEDSTLLLGVRHIEANGWSYGRVLVVEADDGQLFFVGDCFSSYDGTFASYVSTLGGTSPRDALVEISTDAGALQALDEWMFPEREPVAWEDLDPALRILDSTVTPQHVLDAHRLVDIDLVVPDGWRDLPLKLCTRVEAGWNECAHLDAAEPGVTIAMVAYVMTDQPLQLWLFEEDKDLRDPLVQVGETTMSAAEKVLTVEFIGTYETAEEVAAAVAEADVVELSASEG